MKLASLFSNHAILQRNMPVPVWGWTKPSTRVVVTLGEFEAHAVSGTDGKFLARLPAMKEGGPYILRARTIPEQADNEVVVNDVWVGEVWLASGQSNMEWTFTSLGFSEGPKEIATNANIRMLKVPANALMGRQSDIEARWEPADAESVLSFSAVAAYFAKFLSEKLNFKIGIINSSWGGTIIEAWTSRETLIQNPDQSPRLAAYEANLFSPEFWSVKEEPQKSPLPLDPGNEGVKKGWAALDFDDASWQSMTLPCRWTRCGHKYNGIFWFRKELIVPKEWAGKDLALSLGAVDKQDITYFNGQEVGATGKGLEDKYWNCNRLYVVPGKLVKAGRNVIAVRAYSFAFDGGLIGPEKIMYAYSADNKEQTIGLAGDWKFDVEHNFGWAEPVLPPLGPGNKNTPTMLFDCMIAPLLPYAIRGAIWYQGESNADNASEYPRLLRDLVHDWRHAWGQGDFPFYVVQLANLNDRENWPLVREAQAKILEEPNTGLAVAIDLGEPEEIHPARKSEVGQRLSLWALNRVYGFPCEVSGPLYREMAIEGAAIRLRFAHVGNGLVAKGGKLGGFIIAGDKRTFVAADAVIDGDTVIVSSPEVKYPMAVRYAWACNPEKANLYNTADLPASPFRTDTW